MNLFLFHPNPTQNARWHPDKLVCKMPVEITQMVATVADHFDLFNIPKWDPETLSLHDYKVYEPTHLGHPMTQFGRRGVRQLEYMISLGLALCGEYQVRYHREHGCFRPLQYAMVKLLSHERMAKFDQEQIQWTDPADMTPPNCTGDLNRDLTEQFGWDLHESYRQYLMREKVHYSCWAYSPIPPWWPIQEDAGRHWCLLSRRP